LDLHLSLPVETRCINGCDCCTAQDRGRPGPSLDQVSAWMEVARQAGVSVVTLGGGEPMLRKDLGELARAAFRAGLDVEMHTTGRLLAYPKAAALVAGIGFRRLVVPLHSADERVHDAVVQVPGACSQTVNGLRNLASQPGHPPVTVCAQATRSTVTGFKQLVRLIAALPVDHLRITLEGVTPRAMPEMQALADGLAELALTAQAAGLPWSVRGVPPCFVPGGDGLEQALGRPCHDLRLDPAEGRLLEVPRFTGRHVPRCLHCSFQEVCPGVPPFLGAEGWSEVLKPPRRAIPNCFTLEAVGSAPAQVGQCPREAFDTRLDPDAALFLVEPGQVTLLEASTSFFTRANLRETRERGLLYANISTSGSITHFRDQLRRLERLEVCEGCSRPCPGAFRARARSPFGPEEQAVEQYLATMQGDVLDVGFGPWFHAELLERRHDEGHLRWHGLEPDAAACAALRTRRPDLQVWQAPLEGFDAGGRAFDHVLLLRSWNHLADLGLALIALKTLLRPGGRLLVVENLRFGIYTPPRVEPERGGGYEHFRNHDAPQAEAVLAEHGFRVLERQPLRPDGDNQWMLVATLG
jgi:SAM-dependent methyltransferase